jgi:hypothetical protein
LRAKAATDKEESTGNIMQARDQLGHTTVGMTEQYIRSRKGKKVTPQNERLRNFFNNCGPKTNKGLPAKPHVSP